MDDQDQRGRGPTPLGLAATHLGVISDTHGLLRPQVLSALEGVEMIIHAGDVGTGEVLADLRTVAAVRAVRGNMDHAPPASALPAHEILEVRGQRLLVIHDLSRLAIDPAAAGCAVVIHGHTHWPSIEEQGEVLYLNPGSCGPRRSGRPVSLAYLDLLDGGRHRAELIELSPDLA
jgi:putative phosphoesterase